MDRRRKDLFKRARRRGGLLVPEDFRAAGYGKNWASAATQRGELQRLQPRVWGPSGVPDSRLLRIGAAALAAGERAAVSHATAAELHELSHLPRAVRNAIHISFPRGVKPAVKRVTAHFPARLPAEHITVVKRVRVTTIDRTAADLSSVLARGTYERLVDAIVAEGRTEAERLWAVAALLGPFPGRPVLAAVLERIDPRMRGTRSEVERRFFRGLRSAGVPLPTADVPVTDADGRTRYLDFAYVEERLPMSTMS